MTSEESVSVMRVMLAAREAAFLRLSPLEMKAVARVLLFLSEEFLAHPKCKAADYTEVITQMVCMELGIKEC